MKFFQFQKIISKGLISNMGDIFKNVYPHELLLVIQNQRHKFLQKNYKNIRLLGKTSGNLYFN